MKKLLLALLLLGIALRVIVFFQNRSLFLDEANLARNIIEKPVAQFFQPLDYEQYAPPLFLILEKANTLVFGNTEYALRLLPLCMGIATLIFFYLILLKKFEFPPWLWFPLLLLALSPEMIRYSTEVKQYMVDTGLGIGLIWLVLQMKPERWNTKTALIWSIIGSTLIWLSMPGVFILSGIGLYYLYSFIKDKNSQALGQCLLVIGSWLISFGVFYWHIVRPSLATDLLTNYHHSHFLPLFPTSQADWIKAGKIMGGLFRIPFGYTTLAYICGIGLFLSGVYSLFKQHKDLLILLGVPILSCLLASGLGFYSLMPRLSLFLVPLILLISANGVFWLWSIKSIWLRYSLIALFLVMIPAQNGYQFFYQRLVIEELKPVMAYINKQQQTNDLIYLHIEATPAFLFYQNLHDHPIPISKSKIHSATWDETPAQALEQLERPDRIWLVFSHLISTHSSQTRDENKETIPGNYTLVDKIEIEGAAAYLFEAKVMIKE